jgi:hypothetical protein
MDKAFKKLTKDDFLNFGDYVEGLKTVPENAKEAVETWKKISKQIADKSQEFGIKITTPSGEKVAFKPLDNYYPYFVKEEKLKEIFANQRKYSDFLEALSKNNKITISKAHEIIQDVVNGRADFYGHLERSRTAKMPFSFYERDPRQILSQYISEAWNRIGDAKEFGGDDSILQKIIDTARVRGSDFEEIQALTSRFLGRDKFSKSLEKVSSFARMYNNLTKLSLASITNLGDLTKPFIRTNFLSSLKGIVRSFTKEGKEFAGKSGVLNPVLEQFAKEQGLGEKFFKYSGFQATEQKLRQIQANSARYYIDLLYRKLKKNPKNAFVWRRLEQFGIDPKELISRGLKESDYVDGAIKAIADTQPASKIDIPYYWQSPTGKLLTQYKTFAYKQMKFLNEFVFKEAKQGNLKPLIMFLVMGTALGEGVGDMKAYVRGRQRPDTFGARIIDNLMTIGGMGLASDFIANLQYGTLGGGFLKFVAGPTLSDIDAWLTAIQGDVSTIVAPEKRFAILGHKTSKGRPQFKTLKKVAYSLPFIGPALANKMFPTKSTYKARTIPIAEDILQLMSDDKSKD